MSLVLILFTFLTCLDSLCALLSMINNGENQEKVDCVLFLVLYLISGVMNNVEVKQGQI